jgi:hypothetical protein
MNLKDFASESEKCNNGCCTRSVYRGKYCFRCWAGVKWTSIVQRVENRNGNNPSYVGVPIGYKREEFIDWVLSNPPPEGLEVPSIDRIDPAQGYSPGNIRWIERNRNSSKSNRDVDDGFRICGTCKTLYPATPEYFVRTKLNKTYGLSTKCRACNLTYQRKWRASKKQLCK